MNSRSPGETFFGDNFQVPELLSHTVNPVIA